MPFEPQDLPGQLQKIVDNFRIKLNISGIQAAVYIPQNSIINIFSGYTDNTQKKPIDRNTLFEIGSCTKSFTSMAVLNHLIKSKIKLDDTLDNIHLKYPQFQVPPQWQQKNITLRSLLSMRSGVPDYLTIDLIGDMAKNPEKQWQYDELTKYSYTKPMDFLPDTYWHYSNTGYIVAGQILEAATGQSVKEIFDESFIGSNSLLAKQYPWLALNNTFYFPKTNLQITNRLAHGYCADLPVCANSSTPFKPNTDITNLYGSAYQTAGGIFSTAEDIALWVRGLFIEKIFPDEFTDLTTLYCDDDEDNQCYPGIPLPAETDQIAYGMGVGFIGNLTDSPYGKLWNHNGATLSYTSSWILTLPTNVIVSYTINIRSEASDQNLIQLYAELYPVVCKTIPGCNVTPNLPSTHISAKHDIAVTPKSKALRKIETEEEPVNGDPIELSVTSAAAKTTSWLDLPFSWAKKLVDMTVERVFNPGIQMLSDYAKDVVNECPSYFPKNNLNYWHNQSHGLFFKKVGASSNFLMPPNISCPFVPILGY